MRPTVALILLLAPLAAPAVLAQDNAPEAPRDTAFQARIAEMWAETRENQTADRDSLWRALADELWTYYEANPETHTGRRAFRNAFTMWGNTDAVAEASAAAESLGDDSPLWPDALHALQNAYARGGRADEYAAQLADLESRLTHPLSAAQVLWDRGTLALRDGREADARAFFDRLVALDADSVQVSAARGQLYEMDRLSLGMEAPNFTATTLRGEPLALSDLRGRVVLVDFWATWCGPCLPDIPHLVELDVTYSPEDFAIVGVSLDWRRSDLEAMVEAREMDWAHVWEEREWEGEIAQAYNVRHLPRTFLVDREGRIVAKDLRRGALADAIAAEVGAP